MVPRMNISIGVLGICILNFLIHTWNFTFIHKKNLFPQTLQDKYGIKLDESTTSVCSKSGEEWSDEWIECMARYYTDPQNHQLGTAAISRVVDSRLKVLGFEG